MAAIAYPMARRPVRSRPAPVPAPVPAAAVVYRRRRVAAVVVVTVIAVLSVMALRGALAGPGGGPLTATGSAGVGPLQPAAVHIHVVQPGETLWSIVRGQRQAGDPRPAVDRLAAQTGGRPLEVGQRLVLP